MLSVDTAGGAGGGGSQPVTAQLVFQDSFLVVEKLRPDQTRPD